MDDDTAEDTTRSASILTNAQRAYLRGEKDYRPAVERDVRKRIRDRIIDGLDDISLIMEELDVEEFEKAKPDDAPTSDVIALGVLLEEISPDYGTGTSGEDPDETELAGNAGFRTAFQKLNQSLDSVDISIDRGKPLDELADEDLSELSDEQLGQLLAAGEITRQEMFIKTMGEEGPGLPPDQRSDMVDVVEESLGMKTDEDAADKN